MDPRRRASTRRRTAGRGEAQSTQEVTGRMLEVVKAIGILAATLGAVLVVALGVLGLAFAVARRVGRSAISP